MRLATIVDSSCIPRCMPFFVAPSNEFQGMSADSAQFSMLMAEGVGFEPTREREPPGGFQDRCLKPLGHPSLSTFIAFPSCRHRPQHRVCYRIATIRLKKRRAAPRSPVVATDAAAVKLDRRMQPP